MMEDKNIDRLFQEGLKDFEVQPNERVWQNIEERLTKKKKRRIIPFWWLSGGIAAGILITFLLVNPEENNTISSPSEIESYTTPVVIDNKTIEVDTSSVNPSNSRNKIEKVIQENHIVKTIKKKEATTEKLANQVENTEHISNKNNRLVAHTPQNLEKEKKDRNKTIEKNSTPEQSIKNTLAENTSNHTKKNSKETEKKVDNTLALLGKEEPTEKEEKSSQKWSITPVVGVIKSGSFTGGSSLDATLNENTISSNETFTYGMRVSYKLDEKWSLRTGVQLQKTVFNTENVAVVSNTVRPNNLSNVSFNSTEALSFFSLESNNSSDALGSPSSFPNNFANTRGSIQQTYSYFEVPVEVQYQVFSSKTVKTQLISGISTLFLNENSIAVNSPIFNQELGEANNINSFNFSGNLGINFDIQLTKSMLFNLNPMMKAQLNTFSENNNGFSPFTFGIYSGVSFTF